MYKLYKLHRCRQVDRLSCVRPDLRVTKSENVAYLTDPEHSHKYSLDLVVAGGRENPAVRFRHVPVVQGSGLDSNRGKNYQK